MVGFRARYESGDFVLDETEIAEAAGSGGRTAERLPNSISISATAHREWRREIEHRARYGDGHDRSRSTQE